MTVCDDAVRGGAFGLELECKGAGLGENARAALDAALSQVEGNGPLRRTLLFARKCVGLHRPITDVEALFLLEDLKRAGAGHACLVDVRNAMRRDNAAVGCLLRDGGLGGCPDLAPAEPSAADGHVLRVGKAALVKWRTPTEELDGLAQYVQQAVRCGGEGACASRVCVAVPNERWGHMAQRALEHRRFPVSRTQLGYGLAEDPRCVERAQASAAFNALNLLALPNDPLAWRVWCGLGQADLGAGDWAALLSAGLGVGLFDVRGALDLAVSAGLSGSAVYTRLKQGERLVGEASALRGYSLLHVAHADEVTCLSALSHLVDADDGPASLFDKVQRCLCGPVFSPDPNAVHVVTHEAVPTADRAGAYGLVAVAGAVEGLEGRGRSGAASEMRRALSLPCEELVISYFASMLGASARKVGIESRRTRVVEGVEMAHVEPAQVLASLGEELPATQDGQAFLAL